MLSPEELEQLAVRIEERLERDPTSLPVDLLPGCVDARSRATAVMLEIWAGHHNYDLSWLQSQLTDAALTINKDDLVDLLRMIFRCRFEMRQPVAWIDFARFGIGAQQLRLCTSVDRAFLGQQVLPSFRIDERIAAGGVAVVFRGVNLADGTSVAIKIPRIREIGDSADRYAEAVRTEAETLSMLQGVIGVPKLLAFEETEFGPVLVLNWIEALDGPGISPRLPFKTRLQVLAQVAWSLDLVHRNRLIHGDVKSDNILLDKTGRVWLLDFNITRLIEPGRTEDVRLPGTISTMSPETLAGRNSGDEISQDIYSLGALLFEVLCGRPLVAASDRKSALKAAAERAELRLKFPAGTPEDLISICESATSVYHFRRFATASDFATCLERYNAGLSSSIPPRRPNWDAWNLANRFDVCCTKLKHAVFLLNGFTDNPSEDGLIGALQFCRNAAQMADDINFLLPRIGWDIPPFVGVDRIYEYVDGLFEGKEVHDQSPDDFARHWLQALCDWTAQLPTLIETHYGASSSELVLLFKAAWYLKQCPYFPQYRAAFPSLAEFAGIPQWVIQKWQEGASGCRTFEEWFTVCEVIRYLIEVWLLWGDDAFPVKLTKEIAPSLTIT